MFKNFKSIICLIITVIIATVSIATPGEVMASDIILESDDVTTKDKFSEEEQKVNAINMLNYIVALTEEIQENSGSKLYMEEVFDTLVNNTHPNAVDSLTLREVQALLNSLKDYRMVDVNRERLEYILEQDKAQALRQAVPDPMALLSMSRTKSPLKIAASIAYMAIDAKTGYDTASAEADMKYMEKNWELDEKAYDILTESSTDLFTYMVNMVNSNHLDGDLSLNQEMVEDFVEWKKKDNVTSKIQHFENAAKSFVAYKHFGPYWLEMAECYYEDENYQKCLDAIDEYENLNIKIYRRDYEFAKILPKVIVAAKEVLPDSKYTKTADKYCELILDNSKTTDWASRYFVAETYMTLYANSKDKDYLQSAYDIVVENVNNLIDEQSEKNSVYLKEVEEKDVNKNYSKAQEKEVKAYNKMIKSVRKTELVPVTEPLLLNCELLFTLADQLKINNKEKERINKILHSNGKELFLNPILDSMYTFDAKEEDINADDIDIEFNGKEIVLPAMYLTDDSAITVSVSGNDSTIEDWTIKNVNRKKGKPVDTFTAHYESKKATKVKYKGGETISISILPREIGNMQPLEFKYEVKKDKRVGFLNKWKWLDQASEWSDDIQFERVKS